MHRLAFLLRVSAQAVLTWIRACAQEHTKKPEPGGRTLILELDEMWQYLKQKRHTLWSWNALDRDTGPLLDWECGRRDKATMQKLIDRLAQGDVKLYGTDQWATYASVIPADKLVQSQATTHAIERNHCRQRHWFGRFKRQSIIISKSQEMVDLTMALFAKFWIHGNHDELLSLLACNSPTAHRRANRIPWRPPSVVMEGRYITRLCRSAISRTMKVHDLHSVEQAEARSTQTSSRLRPRKLPVATAA